MAVVCLKYEFRFDMMKRDQLHLLKMNVKTTSGAVVGNELTFASTHGYVVDTAVTYHDNAARCVTGLTPGTTYFVKAGTDGTKLKLSATKGGASLAISGGAAGNSIGIQYYKRFADRNATACPNAKADETKKGGTQPDGTMIPAIGSDAEWNCQAMPDAAMTGPFTNLQIPLGDHVFGYGAGAFFSTDATTSHSMKLTFAMEGDGMMLMPCFAAKDVRATTTKTVFWGGRRLGDDREMTMVDSDRFPAADPVMSAAGNRRFLADFCPADFFTTCPEGKDFVAKNGDTAAHCIVSSCPAATTYTQTFVAKVGIKGVDGYIPAHCIFATCGPGMKFVAKTADNDPDKAAKCAVCDCGTFSTTTDALGCATHETCATEGVQTAGTASTDAVCNAAAAAVVTKCGPGKKFVAHDGATAAKCVDCGGTTFNVNNPFSASTSCETRKLCDTYGIQTAGDHTKDNVCGPDKCPAGQKFTALADTTASHCTACATGKFNSNNDRSAACTTWASCATTSVKTVGTLTTNQICVVAAVTTAPAAKASSAAAVATTAVGLAVALVSSF